MTKFIRYFLMSAIDMNAFIEKQKNLFSKLDKIRNFY